MANSRNDLEKVLDARHQQRKALAGQLASQPQTTRDAVAIAAAKATTNPQRATRN